MQSQKLHEERFNRKLKIFSLFLASVSFLNLVFSHKTFAIFTPTLSASIDNTAASVNGNQVISSTDKTTEIPLNLTVNTNNKTGYTATLNSETDETALVNNDSTTGAKIKSISSAGLLGDFSNNTWGVKVGNSTSFSPIPKLTAPMNAVQTAGKTNGNEINNIKLGLKLGDNLESGRYTNKLIFSILTNNYDYTAIMTYGDNFNGKLRSLETATNKIEHFKKSAIVPAVSMNAVNIEDGDSDYEIKLWLDPTDKTAYYYAEPEKIYLNKDSSRMFFRFDDDERIKNIQDMDLSNFDTSKVTNMRTMFTGMSKLTTLNLSNFDTSNVTNMFYMFSSMPSLTTLNLSSFDTSKVTSMDSMFRGMSSLATLDLSSFHTPQVKNMRYMFYGMSSLTNLNLSHFDTSKVTDMGAMFQGLSSLAALNLSSFDTSKVTNISSMFLGMSSLTTLNFSNFDTSSVTDMGHMFNGVSSLTTLNLSNFDTSKVMDMSAMFADMSNLVTLDLSNFNTSNVTNARYLFYLQDGDKLKDKLEKIYVNNDFDTANLARFTEMFKNRKKLRGGNGSFLSDPLTADKSWLRVDRPGVQGYFTRKP